MNQNEKHWRQKDVLIKFSHLNPALQEIIGRNISEHLSRYGIRAERRWRLLSEISLGGNLAMLMRSILPGTKSPDIPTNLVGIGVSASFRTYFANVIRKLHQSLANSMKQFGLLQTRFEGNYPRDWINPTIVANTHPVFHVKGNGDLVFHRPTRIEYARMKFQEKWPGKHGLQPWRWRAYLEKPQAPEPVRKWAAKQIMQWAREAAAAANALGKRPESALAGARHLKKFNQTKTKRVRRKF